MEILNDIPFELDTATLLSKVHIKKGSKDAEDLQNLLKTITSIVKPKAIYKVSYIQSKGYDTVKIGGVTFASRVLRVNLNKVKRVFPYIATCGRELDEIVTPSDDFIRQFWLDTIKGMALDASVKYLSSYLERKYALGQTSRMSPGAGARDLWPIEQQKQLFSLFGNVEDLIGVKLTDSFLMIPNKSVSGIFFPAEIRFESCRLCDRQICSGRKAPYNRSLWESYYRDKI